MPLGVFFVRRFMQFTIKTGVAGIESECRRAADRAETVYRRPL
jgi:hypothetical protein